MSRTPGQRIAAAVVAVLGLLFGMVVAVAAPAQAATTVTVDGGGENDIDPNSKKDQGDLTAAVRDGTATFGWAWDETTASGNNSLDTCTYLFDAATGGYVVVCYSVTFGAPTTSTTTVYDCSTYKDGKCTGTQQVSTRYSATCSAPESVDAYFTNDPDRDLRVTCTLQVIGGGGDLSSLRYVNTCSKNSGSQTAVNVDCIFGADPGFLQVRKVVDGGPAVATDFTLTATGPATISGAGDTGVQTVPVGGYAITESSVTGYALASVVCNGTALSGPPYTAQVTALAQTTCVVTNRPTTRTLTITKTTTGGNGTFTFTVTCTNPASTQQVSVTTSNGNGSATVTVPAAATCTATETTPDGWTLDGASGPRAFVDGTATFANTRQGSLVIAKAGNAPTGTVFPIDYVCTGGTTQTVDVAVGASTTVGGITGGASCTVSETSADYDVTLSPAGGTVVVPAGGEATVTVTNTRKTAALTVTKNVVGGTGTFTFAVSCTRPGSTESFTASVTVAGNTTRTVDGIPTGLLCTVTETDIPAGFSPDALSRTATVPGGVTFTNTGTGTLQVTKEVVGGPEGATFEVRYSCVLDGVETAGSFSLADGDPGTRTGLVGGSVCTVTETAEGYTAAFDPAAPVTIEAGETAAVTVTNTRDTDTLTIVKNVVGGTGTFTFDVSCENAGPTETFVEKGVTITGSGQTTVDGIPTGLTCTVAEVALPAGFTPDTESVKVASDGTATFTNIGRGTLEVTKTVSGSDDGRAFAVDYTCTADDVTTTGTLSLKNGDTGTVEDLVGGTTCTVTEQADGYTASVDPAAGVTIEAGETATIRVTNTRITEALTIKKVARGGDSTFDFTVVCTGGTERFPATGAYAVEITTTDGDGSATVPGIPSGLECTVTEVDLPAGFAVDQAEQKAPSNGTVTFTNTGTGTLQIVKRATGAPAGATFTIGYDCTDGTKGSVTLAAGGRGDVGGILGGSTCTLTETAAGYTAVIEPKDGVTISPGATSEVVVTNTRTLASLVITKVAVGGTATFTFDVACVNPDNANETLDRTVTIEGSGSVPVDGIPTGLTCTVTETDIPAGFTVDDREQTASPGEEVTFTNTGRGSLTVVKQAAGAPAGAMFTIAYSCTGGPSGSVDLAAGESAKVEGILGGAVCTVTESAPGWTPSIDPAGGVTVVAGENRTVTVTNTRDTGTLTIAKTVVGGAGTFTFDVSCLNPDNEKETFTATGVSVAGGSSTDVTGVPSGLDCEVTETDIPAGFTPDVNPVSAASDGTAAFRNVGRGDLRIAKVSDGPAGLDFRIGYDCTDGTRGTVTLSGGENETVTGVLGGSTCTVTESASGYTATVDASPATITAGRVTDVTVTNRRTTTTLTITKATVGGDGTFTFDVVCRDEDERFPASGPATVQVTTSRGAGSVLVEGIPTGLECTVTERATAGWLADATSLTVTAGSSAAFRNRLTQDVTMTKYYDANVNGTRDAGEPGIAGWQFRIGETTYTSGATGSVTTPLPTGSYAVTEGSAAGWVHVSPSTVTVTAPGSASFGNVCLGSGDFHTIGWWKNRNGQRLIGKDDLAALNALHLVGADGTAVTFTSAGQVATWLGKATATNMAYMLSAQLASTVLGTLNGYGDDSALVYAPGIVAGTSFLTVEQLVAAADQALAADGSTPSGDPNRALQGRLKDALDGVNNGTNVVQATPCRTPTAFTF